MIVCADDMPSVPEENARIVHLGQCFSVFLCVRVRNSKTIAPIISMFFYKN